MGGLTVPKPSRTASGLPVSGVREIFSDGLAKPLQSHAMGRALAAALGKQPAPRHFTAAR